MNSFITQVEIEAHVIRDRYINEYGNNTDKNLDNISKRISSTSDVIVDVSLEITYMINRLANQFGIDANDYLDELRAISKTVLQDISKAIIN